MMQMVHRINKRALQLFAELIELKEKILREPENCRLFSFNYPLLIRHILREARLYRSTIENLMHNRQVSYKGLSGTEGILSCDISSVILPLLADHVLREANHYIRILQCAHMSEDA